MERTSRMFLFGLVVVAMLALQPMIALTQTDFLTPTLAGSGLIRLVLPWVATNTENFSSTIPSKVTYKVAFVVESASDQKSYSTIKL